MARERLVYVGFNVMCFFMGHRNVFVAKFQFNERNCKPVFAHSKTKSGICEYISQDCSKPLEARGAKSRGWLVEEGFGSGGPIGDGSLDWPLYLNKKMFHLAEETALFQCSGRLFLFSFVTRACFGFGAKNWGALPMLGPCKL